MAGQASTRHSARYSGRRAALDPVRAHRVGRRISSCCLIAALGVSALLVAAASADPAALERLQDQPTAPAAEASSGLDLGVAALAARLERAPDDLDGWSLLARSYATLGDTPDAAEASLHVAALRAHDPGRLAEEAETRIAANGGIVTPDARRLIDATLALDPADVRARFLLGLAEAQADQAPRALATWRALAADAPPGAPWLAAVRDAIERVSEAAAP